MHSFTTSDLPYPMLDACMGPSPWLSMLTQVGSRAPTRLSSPGVRPSWRIMLHVRISWRSGGTLWPHIGAFLLGQHLIPLLKDLICWEL